MIINKRVYHDIWNSDIVVLFRRLGLIYLILMLCRVAFYIDNKSVIGDIDSSELWSLFKGALQFDSISIIYSLAPFLLLSVIPFRARKKEWYQSIIKWYTIVITIVITFLNLGDIIYFKYTQSRFNVEELFFFDNDNTGKLIGQFGMENWYLVLLWIVLNLLLWYGWRWCGKPKTAIKNRYYYFIANTLIMLLFTVLVIWVVRGCTLSRSTRPIILNSAMTYTDSVHKASMILSNPFCIVRTYGRNEVVERKYFPDNELDAIFTPIHIVDTSSVDTKYFGSMRGKNIFIFTLESFGAELSAYLSPDVFPDGEDGYTPFLDSLMREGLIMRRSYSNGSVSVEALPAILSSMPSLKSSFVFMPASLGEGKQLPRHLLDMGYETVFFCGSPKESMGFDAYANSIGMNNRYSMDEYEDTDRADAFDGYWGIYDEEFFDYTGAILSQMKEPFFGTIFTVSSHHPYVVPERYKNILPEGMVAIHRPVAYTDMSLRLFFDKYSDEDWFQNTLFIFIADHTSSARYAVKSSTLLGRQHIITAFYTPDGSLRGDYNSVFTQLDVMPTLLGLLGNRAPYYAFGRDIFNEPQRRPLMVNYNNDFIVASDSLTVIYNDKRDEVVGVYSYDDVLMQDNLYLNDKSIVLNNLEALDNLNSLKAIIQQYYNSIRERKYVVD